VPAGHREWHIPAKAGPGITVAAAETTSSSAKGVTPQQL